MIEKVEQLDNRTREDLFDFLLRLGDDRLILGHRLSEWCGHGPILEEDIALANIALDCIGQAASFLKLAGEVEGKGRDEDKLAYFREAIEFRNLMLLEQPNTDFAYTMARQFIYDAYSLHLYEALQASHFQPLAAIAAKSLKEVKYHFRHSSQWVLRLGDGTDESHQRIQTAFDDLWMYTKEIFAVDDIEKRLIAQNIIPDNNEMLPKWEADIQRILTEATLTVPGEQGYYSEGSRQGRHTEHLGYILSLMQILPRSYPNAQW
jgi:ring-1,2-phenylacetyl-CoA epoxidase subunit PaaC